MQFENKFSFFLEIEKDWHLHYSTLNLHSGWGKRSYKDNFVNTTMFIHCILKNTRGKYIVIRQYF